jgi:hypothetical protein
MARVSVFHISLTISNRQALDIRDANSGSWVVDALSYEVYGHLVASDAFREGYVIPLAMEMIVKVLKKSLLSQRTLVLCNRARSKRYQRHQERNATLHLFTTIVPPIDHLRVLLLHFRYTKPRQSRKRLKRDRTYSRSKEGRDWKMKSDVTLRLLEQLRQERTDK